ncbi:hypothetical protein ABW21_db0202838 [Orbilia brochopaga]|nr:hypothetical protein ABW21_db0202838 [Drechslerella brochopaga]
MKMCHSYSHLGSPEAAADKPPLPTSHEVMFPARIAAAALKFGLKAAIFDTDCYPTGSCGCDAIGEDGCPLSICAYDAATFSDYVAIAFEYENARDVSIVGSQVVDIAIGSVSGDQRKLLEACERAPVFKKVIIDRLSVAIRTHCPHIESA